MTRMSNSVAQSTTSVVSAATEAYRRAFNEEPSHIAFAPGRANIIGDHTDYCGGYVLPIALDIGCACALGPTNDGSLEAIAVDLIAHERSEPGQSLSPDALSKRPSWFKYVAGTYETVRAHAKPSTPGAKIAVSSSVPVGSGLSSSAAIEVSIATALDAMWSLGLSPLERALLCQAAEHTYPGVPCGIMDQYASAAGKKDHAVRIDCRTNEIELVPMPDPDRAAFVLFDSAVKHANASGEYAKRRAACESAAAKLGVAQLREITVDQLARLPDTLNDEEQRATLHVVTENARVIQFSEAAENGDLVAAGERMSESHTSLSEVYRVSCTALDALQRACIAQPGVYGARMTGGGFGGWIIALVDPNAIDDIAEAVAERFHAETGQTTSHRIATAADGAMVL